MIGAVIWRVKEAGRSLAIIEAHPQSAARLLCLADRD
jgi:hypothetical protein